MLLRIKLSVCILCVTIGTSVFSVEYMHCYGARSVASASVQASAGPVSSAATPGEVGVVQNGQSPTPASQIQAEVSREQPSMAGNWVGVVDNHFGKIELILQVEQDANGYRVIFNLPKVGRAWFTQNVRVTGEQLRFQIPLGSELDEIVLDRAGNTLNGSWSSSGWENDASIALTLDPTVNFPEEVRFEVEGEAGRIGGSLLIPKGDGPFPGVVILHGSGPEPRSGGYITGRQMADRGIMVCVFDKRGAGDSDGDWLETDFRGLASDGIVMAKYLAAHPLTDPNAIGFLGHSQAGWTVPLAASMWDKAAFIVTRSGAAVPPSKEGDWDLIRHLRINNFSKNDIELAVSFCEAWRHGVRTNDWSPCDEKRRKVAETTWYDAAGGSRMLARPEPKFAKWYAGVMDFEPVPVIENLEIPYLAILAREDESVDAVETAGILEELKQAGADINIVLYEGYDHGIRKLQQEPPIWRSHPDDYFSIQAEFILSATAK